MATRTNAVVMFLAVLLYFSGFMLTDYGASMRVSGGHGESLLLAETPPRIVYHSGLVGQMVGFFLLYTVSVEMVITRTDHEYT